MGIYLESAHRLYGLALETFPTIPRSDRPGTPPVWGQGYVDFCVHTFHGLPRPSATQAGALTRAVVATDSVSARADCDNGTAAAYQCGRRWRLKGELRWLAKLASDYQRTSASKTSSSSSRVWAGSKW
jgi:hypothetical protein